MRSGYDSALVLLAAEHPTYPAFTLLAILSVLAIFIFLTSPSDVAVG